MFTDTPAQTFIGCWVFKDRKTCVFWPCRILVYSISSWVNQHGKSSRSVHFFFLSQVTTRIEDEEEVGRHRLLPPLAGFPCTNTTFAPGITASCLSVIINTNQIPHWMSCPGQRNRRRPGTCARDRRALQQHALNVHIKHS